ncbi:hypothetical protein Tco_1489713, partial [Tanacetum coccineum]
EQLVGVPKLPAVNVSNPTVGSTKGRKNTNHNKRTCPGRFEGQDEVVQEKVDLAEDKEELVEEDEDLIHE